MSLLHFIETRDVMLAEPADSTVLSPKFHRSKTDANFVIPLGSTGAELCSVGSPELVHGHAREAPDLLSAQRTLPNSQLVRHQIRTVAVLVHARASTCVGLGMLGAAVSHLVQVLLFNLKGDRCIQAMHLLL